MIAFIGLGNIGEKYKKTKHNAGFWVMDQYVHRKKLSFKGGPGEYVFAQHQRLEMILVKPTTGMNRSGLAVQDVSKKWNLLPSDIYIILDDVDLPLGTLRIRPKGGDGCHRGMMDIIRRLGSNNIARIRFGIGTNDENMRPAERYVLRPFNPVHEMEVEKMVEKCADALESIAIRGINISMNYFNR